LVFGLPRAFMLAGAENAMTSLWAVPDRETRELMEAFYRHLLQGVPPRKALRQAQLDFIRRARDEGRSPDPFFWGAFIHTGIGFE
jgi:CHAT domain-containing protein